MAQFKNHQERAKTYTRKFPHINSTADLTEEDVVKARTSLVDFVELYFQCNNQEFCI